MQYTIFVNQNYLEKITLVEENSDLVQLLIYASNRNNAEQFLNRLQAHQGAAIADQYTPYDFNAVINSNMINITGNIQTAIIILIKSSLPIWVKKILYNWKEHIQLVNQSISQLIPNIQQQSGQFPPETRILYYDTLIATLHTLKQQQTIP